MSSKIKSFISGLTVRQIVFSLMSVISLILYIGLTVWCSSKINALTDQQAAKRWDEEGGFAQVSCFISKEEEIDDFKIKSFNKQLETVLRDAAIVAEDETKRLYADAYSAQGKVTVESDKGKLEANALGIGGDFFLFHPLPLVAGGYFSGNDLMKDAIVLDEEGAWQLFGSSNITGQTVYIGNIPHYIAGVIKREKGKFAESAGLATSVVFMSNESLEKYGTSEGINTYELLAPNPVKGFVYRTIKEKFGVDENKMVVIENSSRFSLESQIITMTEFGTRSMQNAAVRLPYWENIARGWEDVKSVIFIFQVIFILIPTVILAVFLIIKWKNRTFTMKDIGHFIVNTKDKAIEKARGEKNKWKHF